GIPGVGEKTAVSLLQTYGTIENMIANRDSIKGKLGENIRTYHEQAIFSKELSTIDTRTPLPFGLEDIVVKQVDEDGLVNFYKRLELKQLVIGIRKKDTLFTVDDNSDFEYKVLKTEDELKTVLNQNLAVHFEFSEFNY